MLVELGPSDLAARPTGLVASPQAAASARLESHKEEPFLTLAL